MSEQLTSMSVVTSTLIEVRPSVYIDTHGQRNPSGVPHTGLGYR